MAKLQKCCVLFNVHNVKIVNGRIGDDNGIGNHICNYVRGSSTIDYAVACATLFPNITNFYVDTFDMCLSDVHSPICIVLTFDSGSDQPVIGSTP